MLSKISVARRRLLRDLYKMMRARRSESVVAREKADPRHRGFLRVYENCVEVKVEAVSRRGQTGVRGVVTEYSDKSRNRFRRALNRLHWPNDEPVYFLTLTYPDEFTADPEQVHTDLNTFFKRLERWFPAVAVMWRLEWKRRRQGVNAGRVAPHFHMLLFHWPSGVPCEGDLIMLQDWVRVNWVEIAFRSSGADPDLVQKNGKTAYQNALINGTRVDLINDRKHASVYISKYMAKSDDVERRVDPSSGEILGNESRGRSWGVKGRARLDFSPLVALALTQLQVIAFRLLVEDWLMFKAETSTAARDFLVKLRAEYAAWMGYMFFADCVEFAHFFLDHRYEHFPLAFTRYE